MNLQDLAAKINHYTFDPQCQVSNVGLTEENLNTPDGRCLSELSEFSIIRGNGHEDECKIGIRQFYTTRHNCDCFIIRLTLFAAVSHHVVTDEITISDKTLRVILRKRHNWDEQTETIFRLSTPEDEEIVNKLFHDLETGKNVQNLLSEFDDL